MFSLSAISPEIASDLRNLQEQLSFEIDENDDDDIFEDCKDVGSFIPRERPNRPLSWTSGQYNPYSQADSRRSIAVFGNPSVIRIGNSLQQTLEISASHRVTATHCRAPGCSKLHRRSDGYCDLHSQIASLDKAVIQEVLEQILKGNLESSMEISADVSGYVLAHDEQNNMFSLYLIQV